MGRWFCSSTLPPSPPGALERAVTSATWRRKFKAVGAQPVGISRDAISKQKEFDEKHSLGFPLLSDADRKVAEAFGVKGGMFGLSPVKRTTFVIDCDRTVRAVISSEISMNNHADRALEAVQGL